MVYRDTNASQFISYWRRPPQPPVPTVTGFNPTSGPPGTQVTIIGTNFGCAGCSGGIEAVRFNGASAVFTGNTNTSVTAFVPAGATTGPTSVRTLGGTGTSPSSFTVTPGPSQFTVTATRIGTGTGTVTSDPTGLSLAPSVRSRSRPAPS